MPSPSFANDHESLISRLLGLFPLEVIKNEYAVTGAAGKVHAEIAKKSSLKDVCEDALRLFGHARQHAYLFPHSESDMTKVSTDFFPKEFVHSKDVVKQEKGLLVVEYLLILNYEFIEVINRTADKKRQRHYWPVKIIMRKGHLEIRPIIMEKSMRSTETLHYTGRDVEEEDLVKAAVKTVPSANFAARRDLNKGIKSLWSDDEVDAPDVAHKSSSSVDRATMDTGLTYKQTYPDRYKEIIKSPLRKTAFYVLKKERAKWPYFFSIDPCQGYIAFTRLQSDKDGVDELMDELLKRND